MVIPKFLYLIATLLETSLSGFQLLEGWRGRWSGEVEPPTNNSLPNKTQCVGSAFHKKRSIVPSIQKAKKQGPKSQGTNPQISDESQTPRASLNPLVSWLRCALSAFSTYCTSTTAGARHEWFRSQALPGRLFWRLATTSDEKSGLRFEVDLGTGPLGLGPLRPRYAVHSASNTCNRVHPKGQLGSSTPPTHKRSRLWLLPSGPDPGSRTHVVEDPTFRHYPARRIVPRQEILGRAFSPAIADCGSSPISSGNQGTANAPPSTADPYHRNILVLGIWSLSGNRCLGILGPYFGRAAGI